MADNEKDFYEILGVNRNATQDEIKAAYRKAALKYHPDKNPGDKQSEEAFKLASEAYAILGDGEKRARYDRFGRAGFQGGVPVDATLFEGFEDLLGGLFGMSDFFGGGRRRRASRGADLRYDITLSFEEAFAGKEITIEIPRTEGCPDCRGTGSRTGERHPCRACHGRGTVAFQQGFFTISRTCPQCAGEGQIPRDPCGNCGGRGQVQAQKTVSVRIPAGVDSGSRLRLQGQGEAGERGGPPGDLYVFMEVRPHDFFERDGEHLLCRVPLSFPQAALGTEVVLSAPDGEETLKVPAGTSAGKRFRIAGKGMPRPDRPGRGDLFVEVLVVTPKSLTKEEKRLYGELLRLERDREERGSFFRKVLSKIRE